MSGTNARGTTQTQRLNEPLGTPDTTTPKPDKSHVTSAKNDARDAEAICEAALRPHMRFCPDQEPGDG